MEHNTIGTRIEWLRKENGQTQKEVADAIGVRRETINQWESGTRDLKTGAIIALAKHFNVTSDYILGLSDIKTTDTKMKAVCDYTGLSEDAIRNIKHTITYLTNDVRSENLLKTLNFFLAGHVFTQIIIDCLGFIDAATERTNNLSKMHEQYPPSWVNGLVKQVENGAYDDSEVLEYTRINKMVYSTDEMDLYRYKSQKHMDSFLTELLIFYNLNSESELSPEINDLIEALLSATEKMIK